MVTLAMHTSLANPLVAIPTAIAVVIVVLRSRRCWSGQCEVKRPDA